MARFLKKTLVGFKIKTNEVNLAVLMDELINMETRKLKDVSKILLKCKLLVKYLSYKMKSDCSKTECVELIKETKTYYLKTQSLIQYENLPFQNDKKATFTKEANQIKEKYKAHLKDSSLSSNCTKKLKKALSLQEDFITKILAMTEVNPNTKLSPEEVRVVKDKMLEIRKADVDVLEVLHLIDIEILYDEKLEKRVSDTLSNAKDSLKELELLTESGEEADKSELKKMMKLFLEYLEIFIPQHKIDKMKEFDEILKLYLEAKQNLDKENKKLVTEFLEILFQFRVYNLRRMKITLRKTEKLSKQLKWALEKLTDETSKKLVGEISDKGAKIQNYFHENYQKSLEIENILVSLKDKESVSVKIKQVLKGLLEILKQLQYSKWKNYYQDPSLVSGISNILKGIQNEIDTSKIQADLHIIILKLELYSDYADDPKNAKFKDFIDRILKAKDKSKSINLLDVLQKLGAKNVLDKERHDIKLNWLHDVVGKLDDLISGLKDEKLNLVTEKTKTILTKIIENFKEYKPASQYDLIQAALIKIFKEVDADDDLPSDGQLPLEEIILRLVKFIQDLKTKEALDLNMKVDDSEELVKELTNLLNSEINIFSEDIKEKVQAILDSYKKIDEIMKIGKDLLTDDDIEKLKEAAGILKSNIDNILSEGKLTQSTTELLEKLSENVKDLLDEIIKDSDSTLTNKIEDLFSEIDIIATGEVKELIEDMEPELDKVFEYMKVVNDLGIDGLSDDDLKDLKDSKDKLLEYIEEALKKDSLPDEIEEKLKLMKESLKSIENKVDSQEYANKIEDRINLLEKLSTYPKDDLDKESVIILETIVTNLPFVNEMIENILKNGIGAINPDEIKKLKEIYSQIESGVKVLLSMEPLDPKLKEILEQLKDNVVEDKTLISQKIGENDVKEIHEKTNEQLKTLEKEMPGEDLDILKEKIKEKQDLQNKIAKEGIESLTNEELTKLEEAKKEITKIVKKISEDPNSSENIKTILTEIESSIDDVDEAIEEKMDADKLEKFILQCKEVYEGLNNLENVKESLQSKITKLKAQLKDFIKFLSTIHNEGFEKLDLTHMKKLEDEAEALIDLSKDLQISEGSTLIIKTLLKKLQTMIEDTIKFTETIISGGSQKEIENIVEEIENSAKLDDKTKVKISQGKFF